MTSMLALLEFYQQQPAKCILMFDSTPSQCRSEIQAIIG